MAKTTKHLENKAGTKKGTAPAPDKKEFGAATDYAPDAKSNLGG